MMATVSVLVGAVGFLGWMYSPNSTHPKGWALRTHGFGIRGPYLRGEAIDRERLQLTLFNYSRDSQSHDPLLIAKRERNIQIFIYQPDGKALPAAPRDHLGAKRDPFTAQTKLKFGERSSTEFSLTEFGYFTVPVSGRYRLEATMKIDGGTVVAPSVHFEVVDIPTDAILATCPVLLEGRQLSLPEDERHRPCIQQVRVAGRTILLYRQFGCAKVRPESAITFRLTELHEKCEIKVDGAYGDWGPLTITYKDQNAATVSLKINSVDGGPWSEEDEQAYQRRKKSQPAKP